MEKLNNNFWFFFFFSKGKTLGGPDKFRNLVPTPPLYVNRYNNNNERYWDLSSTENQLDTATVQFSKRD